MGKTGLYCVEMKVRLLEHGELVDFSLRTHAD